MADNGCRYTELAWRIRKLCKHYMRLGESIPWEEVAETLREDDEAISALDRDTRYYHEEEEP